MSFGVVLAHNKLVCRRNMPSTSALTHETSYDAMPLVPALCTKAYIADSATLHTFLVACRHLGRGSDGTATYGGAIGVVAFAASRA